VSVSGIGVVSAFGTSHDAFREGLLSGRTAVATLTAFDVSTCRSILAASLPEFQPAAWVSPMKLRRLDRTGVYALASTRLALDDARVSVPTEGANSVGVVLGTSTAGGQSTQEFLAALFCGGVNSAPALLFDSTVGNSAASLVAIEFKLGGPNITTSNKEASGLSAIVTAVDLIREGSVSGLIAGGIDAIYETVFKAHDVFKVMSPDATFSRRLAPFDAERAGFVMGEGGFVFWLEPGEGASRARQGDILGVAASSAVVPLNAWPDDPEPIARTMHQALEDGGLAPSDIDVVYASANATGALDRVEAQAIVRVFGGSSPAVTSIKGALGESGASGSAACAAALICGAVGKVPPIAGLKEPCPEAAALRLARSVTAADGPIVLVNSFASGGALFSVVLRVAQ
jgi:3-oxoacyl-[acyl-carrier-protein] synthase II